MDNMVDLLVGEATSFTPDVLVRIIVFVLLLDCIASIAHSVMNGWR